MTNLCELLSKDGPNMGEVSSYLDNLDNRTRIDETRTLGRAHQRRLYEAAAGYQPITIDFVVPPGKKPMNEVVHHGKNTLGVFTHFAKVFVRGDGDAPKNELWGYNRNPAFIETVVGPGYFVAYDYRVKGEVLVDYLRTPPRKPAAWPPILSNSARLSVVVYKGTQDVLRGVSKHVSIGHAMKGGKDMPAWFVLCRDDG